MSRRIAQLAAPVAAEIAACAGMARADGHVQIANILDDAAVRIGKGHLDHARSPLRIARKATMDLDSFRGARLHAAMAAEAFERAFGSLYNAIPTT